MKGIIVIMKTDSLDQLSGRYELVVILILILAAPLCAYTMLNLRNPAIQGCGILALIAGSDLLCDVSALFSIRGIDNLKSLEDRSLRKEEHPIKPISWILMIVMSLITLIAVRVILKDADLGMAFLGLSTIKLALSIVAGVLGMKAKNIAGTSRSFRRFSPRRKF